VNVQKWVYEPGLTEERHRPQSALYDEMQEILAAYIQGALPTREKVADWHRYQILSFLQSLPKTIPLEDCTYFEKILDLEKRNDAAHYSFFYELCIRSGYQEILPRVEDFVGQIGRMFYIMPIFRAMVATEWAKEHARPLFERVKKRHHQITVHVVDDLLKQANL
jgi:leukotriene-A4 hydrolase